MEEEDMGPVLTITELPLDWESLTIQDGTISFPVYAEHLYRHMSREDILDLVRYLRRKLT